MGSGASKIFLSTAALVNDVPNCQMWEHMGADMYSVGWAIAALGGTVSGLSGADGLAGQMAEVLHPFVEIVGEAITMQYTIEDLQAYAKKSGQNPNLQDISMPFLAEYAKKQLKLNRAPSTGGKYESDRVTLSLPMQANTMAVVKTGENTADLYTGSFRIKSGPVGNYVNYYYLSRELKNLKKSKITFAVKAPAAIASKGRGGPAIVPKRRSIDLSSNSTVSHLSDLD